jgi:hypothetical protein
MKHNYSKKTEIGSKDGRKTKRDKTWTLNSENILKMKIPMKKIRNKFLNEIKK